MPYYRKEHCKNILFIHIPKTGGTSIEHYLKNKKYHQALYSGERNIAFPLEEFNQYPLQHQYYSTLYKYQNTLNVSINEDTKTFSVVRNPYDRFISDMFFHNYIRKNDKPERVYDRVEDFFQTNRDNHATPQFKFLVDDAGELYNNITIMKTETLVQDMINFGFEDFDTMMNENNKVDKNSYESYLNADILCWINKTYSRDFELFNYKMYNLHP